MACRPMMSTAHCHKMVSRVAAWDSSCVALYAAANWIENGLGLSYPQESLVAYLSARCRCRCCVVAFAWKPIDVSVAVVRGRVVRELTSLSLSLSPNPSPSPRPRLSQIPDVLPGLTDRKSVV